MHVVRYRLTPHTSMPHGPALIHLARTGQLTALVDASYLHPVGAVALGRLGTELMEQFSRRSVPCPSPEIRVRFHPTRDIGGKLVAAELSVGRIDILVDKELIRSGLAEPLGVEVTQIMRHFG